MREDAANPSIINERSAEAGYEPNPTPEEVDQIEAERAAFIRRPARPSAIVETIDSETDAEVDAPGAFEPTDDIAVSSGPAEFGDAELLDVSAPPPARRVRPTAAAEQAMPLRLSLPASDMLRLKLATAILRSDETTIVREALSAYFDQNGVDRFDPS